MQRTKPKRGRALGRGQGVCVICDHPDRSVFELAVARRETTVSAVARKLGLHHSTSQYHFAEHVPKALEAASQALARQTLSAGLALDEEMADLYHRTIAILDTAERTRKLALALGAIREARGNLELIARMTGRLKPDTQVNVLVTSAEWIAMRDRILDALEPYPEALAAVLRAVGE